MSKTDINSSYQDEWRTYNREFAAMLTDEYILNFIAISIYPADGILSAFVVIFIISFSIGCSSRLDIIKYQHNSKLWPLLSLYQLLFKRPAKH
jgi:hypothetical protein